jgi:hypothetical protein
MEPIWSDSLLCIARTGFLHAHLIVPMTRSAYAFCHGEAGAVSTSLNPIDETFRLKNASTQKERSADDKRGRSPLPFKTASPHIARRIRNLQCRWQNSLVDRLRNIAVAMFGDGSAEM